MKRMWIAIGLIGAVIILSTVCLLSLSTAQKELDGELEKLSVLSTAASSEETARAAGELGSLWHKRLSVLCRIVRHTQLDQVTMAIARLEPLALYGEKGEFAAEILRCRILLEEIVDSEKPLIRNIF